jgi:hypothetical protein
VNVPNFIAKLYQTIYLKNSAYLFFFLLKSSFLLIEPALFYQKKEIYSWVLVQFQALQKSGPMVSSSFRHKRRWLMSKSQEPERPVLTLNTGKYRS